MVSKHSYIIELKYLSAKDSEHEAQKQWDEGMEQLRRRSQSRGDGKGYGTPPAGDASESL